MSRATVLILGGGAAGGAAALALAQAGAAVTLVEREAAAREKVCGEFLGPDAAGLLAGLGLDLAALGAVPVRRARLATGGQAAELPLPFRGWGLPRAVLDEALLAAAAAAGARVLRGRSALTALRDGGAGGTGERAGGAAGWAVRLADGEVLRAASLVLATGKHELRGHTRRVSGVGHLGLKLPLRPAVPVDGVVLLPFRGGYAGLQPRPGGEVNLCAALDARAAGGEARDPAALLRRVAAGSVLGAALLKGAVPLAARTLAVARVPYGFVHRDAPGAEPGLYRVGDQFAVVPSLAGEGVAMALCGGVMAAEALGRGVPAPDFHAALARRLGRPMRWAGAASWLLGAAPSAVVRVAGLLPAMPRLAAARTRLPRASGARAPSERSSSW